MVTEVTNTLLPFPVPAHRSIMTCMPMRQACNSTQDRQQRSDQGTRSPQQSLKHAPQPTLQHAKQTTYRPLMQQQAPQTAVTNAQDSMSLLEYPYYPNPLHRASCRQMLLQADSRPQQQQPQQKSQQKPAVITPSQYANATRRQHDSSGAKERATAGRNPLQELLTASQQGAAQAGSAVQKPKQQYQPSRPAPSAAQTHTCPAAAAATAVTAAIPVSRHPKDGVSCMPPACTNSLMAMMPGMMHQLPAHGPTARQLQLSMAQLQQLQSRPCLNKPPPAVLNLLSQQLMLHQQKLQLQQRQAQSAALANNSNESVSALPAACSSPGQVLPAISTLPAATSVCKKAKTLTGAPRPVKVGCLNI